jgi:hypothetical protein
MATFAIVSTIIWLEGLVQWQSLVTTIGLKFLRIRRSGLVLLLAAIGCSVRVVFSTDAAAKGQGKWFARAAGEGVSH